MLRSSRARRSPRSRRSRRRIDDLNVYPVPDGDTGTNLTLTVRASSRRSSARTPTDSAPTLAQRGHPRGADGRARELGCDPLADRARRRRGARPPRLARRGCGGAGPPRRERRRLPRRPRAGRGDDADGHPGARRGGGGRADPDRSRAARRARGRGEEAVARTQELLDVLREAGVVDAGGAGLLELVRGSPRRRRGAAARRPGGALERPVSRPSTRSCRATATAPSSSSRGELDPKALEARARAARRLAARRRRRGRAQGARPHGRARRGARARHAPRRRSTGSRSRTCTARRRRARNDCWRCRPGSPNDASDVVAVVAGRRKPAALREPRRRADRRGRTDDEPVGGGDPRRDRGDPRAGSRSCSRTTRTSCSRPSRPRRSRAKPVEVVPTDVDPGGPRRARSPSIRAAGGRENAADDARGRSRRVATGRGDDRVARRRSSTASPSARASISGLVGDEPVARRQRLRRRSRARSLERLLAEPRDVLTMLTGGRSPTLDGLARRAPASDTRSSRSRFRRAASRTTRSSSRPSRSIPSFRWRRRSVSFWSRTTRSSARRLELAARAALRHRDRRRGRRRQRGGRARARAPSRTSS